MENLWISIKRILLARNVSLCQELCGRLCHMSSHQSTTTKQSTVTTESNPRKRLGNNHHGFHHRPPRKSRIRFTVCCSGSTQQSYHSHPLYQEYHSRRNRHTFHEQRLETYRTSSPSNIRQRTTIRIKSNAGSMEQVKRQVNHVHSISSTNRRRNRTRQSRIGTIPQSFRKLPTRQLGRSNTLHGICAQC